MTWEDSCGCKGTYDLQGKILDVFPCVEHGGEDIFSPHSPKGERMSYLNLRPFEPLKKLAEDEAYISALELLRDKAEEEADTLSGEIDILMEDSRVLQERYEEVRDRENEVRKIKRTLDDQLAKLRSLVGDYS